MKPKFSLTDVIATFALGVVIGLVIAGVILTVSL
jgi:hypothetical protein